MSRKQKSLSKRGLESRPPEVGLTSWVGRLMLLNAGLLVLFETVLTAPIFRETLQFVPAQALDRPWTWISYMFVHDGVLSLGSNLLLLFVFGPGVERRFGGRRFLLYYVYCGVGSAAFALGLSSFMAMRPLLGAGGAALGVGLAFAVAEPEAKTVLYPFERPFGARALIVLLAGINVVLALWLDNRVGHLGYLGGLAAGYILYRLGSLVGHRKRKEPKSIVRRAVMAPMPVRQGGSITEVRPTPTRPEPREEYPAEEVDRVLDKISALGIQSLTMDERRFLNEVSKRKQKDLH
jgi:membrane associated rhomboid family serine protease